MKLTLVAIAGVVAWFGLHRLALWAENRGWIYYKTKRGPLGSYGMALIQATTPFAPEIEHVIEEQQSEDLRAEIRESSAPALPEVLVHDEEAVPST